MPLVGLGTWKAPKGVVATAVEKSIVEAGYRAIDCAADYGNETEVGEGIAKAIASGAVKRSDLFVTSKLWNTFHDRENVKLAVQKSLSDLGLEYLDLYLIHFPIALKFVPIETRYPPEWYYDPENRPGQAEFSQATIRETWEAMEQLVEEGLVRNIGISNFSCALISDLLKYAKIPPAVLQIEHHPYLQQDTLIKFASRFGIHITAYSPFGQISYLPLGQPKTVPDLLTEEPTILKIAAELGKSPAQVILRWITQRQICVIPKSTSVERLRQNIDLDFQLSDDHLQQIKALDKHARFNNPAVYFNYPIFD